MEIILPLIDGPSWMEGLVFTRYGESVHIEVRKTSGADYGHAEIDAKQFVDLLAVLGLRI